jgi:hypothetical protein
MLSQVVSKSGAEPSTTATSTTAAESAATTTNSFSGDKASEKPDNYSHRDINRLSEEHKIEEQEEQKVS